MCEAANAGLTWLAVLAWKFPFEASCIFCRRSVRWLHCAWFSLGSGEFFEPRTFLGVWIGASLGGLLWLVWVCRREPWQIAPGISFGGVLALWTCSLQHCMMGLDSRAVSIEILCMSSWLLAGAAMNLFRHERWYLGAISLTLGEYWLLLCGLYLFASY